VNLNHCSPLDEAILPFAQVSAVSVIGVVGVVEDDVLNAILYVPEEEPDGATFM